MKLPGQCEIKQGGKLWHFYFGIDATAEFLHLYQTKTIDKLPDGKEIETIRDLPLHRFAEPFIENESRALLTYFYCGLLVGDTRKEIPETLTKETFGRWLDGAETGSFAELLAAYTTSKPLGK